MDGAGEEKEGCDIRRVHSMSAVDPAASRSLSFTQQEEV